jgi:hypothetical protein
MSWDSRSLMMFQVLNIAFNSALLLSRGAIEIVLQQRTGARRRGAAIPSLPIHPEIRPPYGTVSGGRYLRQVTGQEPPTRLCGPGYVLYI